MQMTYVRQLKRIKSTITKFLKPSPNFQEIYSYPFSQQLIPMLGDVFNELMIHANGEWKVEGSFDGLVKVQFLLEQIDPRNHYYVCLFTLTNEDWTVSDVEIKFTPDTMLKILNEMNRDVLKDHPDFTIIPQHPEYSISQTGEVWSRKVGRLITPVYEHNTMTVRLHSDGTVKTVAVARLMFMTFRSKDFDSLKQVRHKDGDLENNTIDNLYQV